MAKTKKIRMGAVDWREELGVSSRPSFIDVKTPYELGYTNGKHRSPEEKRGVSKTKTKE